MSKAANRISVLNSRFLKRTFSGTPKMSTEIETPVPAAAPPKPAPTKKSALTTDALVVRKNLKTDRYELLAIQRGREPHIGKWALPGGFVEYGEDPTVGVLRELEEETHLVGYPDVHLITVHGNPKRDPRQHIVTAAYACKVKPETLKDLAGSDDAADARWIEFETAGLEGGAELAFDHGEIVAKFRKWFKETGEQQGFYVEDPEGKQPGAQ
ncbi:NUDIX hydrolase domain-like protein [Polychytrium aggregatum]|uniref:NUDIX hydrolase domain-like protein n=1 Tax=Polychytrium aggregatum TaxID=110093 RepID=UPI0022FEFCEC|nr:NUDIX hydrolase domain-like protein [Polychytrium aggregatum]KAI9199517.1 NUDIX hydrolase domain-like protein [Polychytrium aggregatum]